MPDGLFFAILVVYLTAWVIFALRGVLGDATNHAIRRGRPGAYFFGTYSIALVWLAFGLLAVQRIVFDFTNREHLSVWGTRSAFAAMTFLAMAGWCACRIGLPSVLFRGRPWAWWTFQGGMVLLFGLEVVL